ncbi:wax ester/triacylglycerol synthase family O-acyltransferase [Nocardia wallacei]|uniref:wax ester/triacylglycerol synthase family O-acyltransferase n=1 Tax=Nocardia wallacei TaxID=480035 RepID=UPI00245639E3|nr:wax ester/triacylglycerol synthase family O-acyltransferase [Nocardia wallacei]
MTELSPLDTGFMELEDSDRHISLGIAAAAIIAGPPPSRAEFRAGVDRALRRHRRLRQRVRRSPLDVTAPVWEDDPDFDLGHHIRWTALPGTGDDAAMCELIATELTERLDRDHPLWEAVMVDHLAGDRWAVIVKAHHSMVDGVAGITLFESFCDAAADRPQRGRAPAEPASRGMRQWIGQAVRLPFTAPWAAVRSARTLVPVLLAAVTPTSGTSLNGPIGRQRRYAVARASLTEIREIGAAFGVTINDVAVAALAGAYRRLLAARGERPASGAVRILVPVSVRAVNAKYVLDNRVSAMITRLPTELEDPLERLCAVHDHIARHRSRGEAEAERSLLSLAGLLPSAIVAWTLRTASRVPQRGVAALATNVPGPRRPLRLAGHDVLEIWPCIPVAMRVRTTVAILSYTDRLTFGITADYDSTPDIDVLASGIADEIAVLLDRARRRADGADVGTGKPVG